MSWLDLVKLWSERDERYAHTRRWLTEEEADAIRVMRQAEANQLVGTARLKALSVVNSWQPPLR